MFHFVLSLNMVLINNVHNVPPPYNLKMGENIQFWSNVPNVPLCTFIKHGMMNNVHNVPPPNNIKTGENSHFGTMFTMFHFVLSLNMV